MKELKDKNKGLSSWYLLSLVGELGYIIALPLIILIIIGIWLDTQLNTKPIFILFSIFLALAVSSYIIFKRIKKINHD